jgi:hypothetical protein
VISGTVLRLPATIWLLGFISFLNDTAGELAYPLLPVYLAVALQVEPRIFGFMEGSALARGFRSRRSKVVGQGTR